MTRQKSTALLSLAVLSTVAACAPSPLYVSSGKVSGTGGEVPRDAQGEPLWAAIKPPPPVTAPPPGLTTNPGVPVTPPSN
jgi:hypothetical protein